MLKEQTMACTVSTARPRCSGTFVSNDRGPWPTQYALGQFSPLTYGQPMTREGNCGYICSQIARHPLCSFCSIIQCSYLSLHLALQSCKLHSVECHLVGELNTIKKKKKSHHEPTANSLAPFVLGYRRNNHTPLEGLHAKLSKPLSRPWLSESRTLSLASSFRAHVSKLGWGNREGSGRHH